MLYYAVTMRLVDGVEKEVQYWSVWHAVGPRRYLAASSDVRDGLWTMLETVMQERWGEERSAGLSGVSSHARASRREATARTGTDHSLGVLEAMKSPVDKHQPPPQ